MRLLHLCFTLDCSHGWCASETGKLLLRLVPDASCKPPDPYCATCLDRYLAVRVTNPHHKYLEELSGSLGVPNTHLVPPAA
jgi:hypothetical protein